MMLPALGTADHAELITHNRHPGVQAAMAWLAFAHLPQDLQSLSEPTYVAAMELIERIPTDSAELTTALNKLIEAKDSFVRAGIRNDYGRPGSVPRPAAVVNPPAVVDVKPPWEEKWPETPARPIQDRPQA
jgi:hypothetical protein